MTSADATGLRIATQASERHPLPTG